MRSAGKSLAPVGRCIYCGYTEPPLSKEHIIPFSLGGNLILPAASCEKCARITSDFEKICARGMLGQFRVRADIPTRHPEQRPSEFSPEITRADGTTEIITIPAKEYPVACVGLLLPVAGILVGRRPGPTEIKCLVKLPMDDLKRVLNPGDAMDGPPVNLPAYGKLLAKIAHTFTVAKIGIDSFKHVLPDLILGKSRTFLHYIGGEPDNDKVPETEGYGHKLVLGHVRGTRLIFVSIRLFASIGMPRYIVIAGEDLRD
jgi:hypothetical protein